MCDATVVHMTSVHSRYDIRIFVKECCTSVNAGYEVSLIVADGKGDEHKNGVHILDVEAPKSRLQRMLNTTRRQFNKARQLDADIYHLHDPELIIAGLRLRRAGKVVIFDAHEDFPLHIFAKPYLGERSKRLLSCIFKVFEKWVAPKMNAIVAATPFIRDKFLVCNSNTIDINNYPIETENESGIPDWSSKQKHVCYIGGITATRGIREMVQAMGKTHSGVKLQLCGHFIEEDVESDVKAHPGWLHVDELGWLDRSDVLEVLCRSVAGLVVLHPLPNYIDSQPIKMFEYMNAGIPLIASNFRLWREIVEGYDCGICVDPLDKEAIANAIDYLVEHPDRAAQMGANGQKAVRDHYNWAAEERKLLDLYASLVS